MVETKTSLTAPFAQIRYFRNAHRHGSLSFWGEFWHATSRDAPQQEAWPAWPPNVSFSPALQACRKRITTHQKKIQKTFLLFCSSAIFSCLQIVWLMGSVFAFITICSTTGSKRLTSWRQGPVVPKSSSPEEFHADRCGWPWPWLWSWQCFKLCKFA